MRPLLEAYSANDEGPISDVRRELATQFHLSDEELAERLPSGLARTFDNRVGWAATYLYRTGLLTRPRPAVYQTHQRGRDVLQANPERVDLSVLAHFPEFEEFRRGPGRRRRSTVVVSTTDETATPEEQIDAAYQELRQELAAEILERIHTMPPSSFEDLVLDVLHAMGYGDGTKDARLRTGGVGDRGIDGVIREDRLGLDVVYVQTKRWEANVGRPLFKDSLGRCKAREQRESSLLRPPSRRMLGTSLNGLCSRSSTRRVALRQSGLLSEQRRSDYARGIVAVDALDLILGEDA